MPMQLVLAIDRYAIEMKMNLYFNGQGKIL
jgi:hypothetical protein